jgi:hypothetical protein
MANLTRLLLSACITVVLMWVHSAPSAPPPSPPVIERASTDSALAKLFIDGENFGTAPTVSLAGQPLAVTSVSGGTHIEVALPSVDPGSYLLIVTAGKNASQPFTVTIESGGSAPIFYDANDPAYSLDPNGNSYLSAVYANNWFRAQGNTGILFQDHGAGWYMKDNTWIRQYPEDISHHLYLAGGFDTAYPSGVGCSGSLGGGYNFQVCGSMAADLLYDRNDSTYRVDPSGFSILRSVSGDIFEARDSGQGNAFIGTRQYDSGLLPGYTNAFYPVLGTASQYLYLSIGNTYTGYFATDGYH